VPAADGVDARARRVAARLLPSRARRARSRRGDHPEDGAPADAATPRHPTGAHPAGPARVARALDTLEPDGWTSLAQAHRPGGGPDAARIDHLAIGPGGVVVIDSRAWVGRVEVTRGAVQQNGLRREAQAAAVAATAGRVSALLLPQHRTAVHAFVVVAQHDLAEHVVAPGVHVVGVSGLPRALRALPYRLHPAEVLHLGTVLRQSLVDADAPEQLTTADLEALAEAPPGAHRDPAAIPAGPGGVPDLFVPVVAAGPSPAGPAARRRRPRRAWWRDPRVLAPRLLLTLLLVVAGVLAGPPLLRSMTGGIGDTPVSSVPIAPDDGGAAPHDGTGSAGVVPPLWSGGPAPVRPIPPATPRAPDARPAPPHATPGAGTPSPSSPPTARVLPADTRP